MIPAIGDRLQAVSWHGLSADARRKLLLCLLANLSVAVAGVRAMRLPRPAPGAGHLLVDGGETAGARDAAFHNAALMHANTQDDFHPIGNLHIATVVVPALLAQAERGAVDGEAFLDAMSTGYAACVGLSRRTSPIGTPRGLRSTSLYASLGAAAAVARLRGLGAAGIGNAVALASQSAFGTTQCWRDGSDEYQLHAANAASQALLCADLTAAGVRGGDGALDGTSGFFRALLGEAPSWEAIAGGFDPDAAILETVLKRYPVSGICQPVVRLAERLAPQAAGRRIARVRVEMNGFEMNYPGTLNAGPAFRSFSDRLMSARFCTASVLEVGRFDFDAFLRAPSSELQRLVAATDVSAADDLGTLSCRMTLSLDGGDALRGELRDGGGELAIDWSTIDAWCTQLWADAGRGPEAYPRVRDAVLALPDGRFDALRRALQGAA